MKEAEVKVWAAVARGKVAVVTEQEVAAMATAEEATAKEGNEELWPAAQAVADAMAAAATAKAGAATAAVVAVRAAAVMVRAAAAREPEGVARVWVEVTMVVEAVVTDAEAMEVVRATVAAVKAMVGAEPVAFGAAVGLAAAVVLAPVVRALEVMSAASREVAMQEAGAARVVTVADPVDGLAVDNVVGSLDSAADEKEAAAVYLAARRVVDGWVEKVVDSAVALLVTEVMVAYRSHMCQSTDQECST